MGINIKQNTDGSAGLQGAGEGDGEFVVLTHGYTASSVDTAIFTASRAYVVKSVILRPDVIGSDGGAVTVAVKQAPSGTAIAAGTAVHTGTGDLKGAANTNQVLALSATPSDLYIAAGSSLGLDFTGTLTAAVGRITVTLCPA
jgi:hypothetical protein